MDEASIAGSPRALRRTPLARPSRDPGAEFMEGGEAPRQPCRHTAFGASLAGVRSSAGTSRPIVLAVVRWIAGSRQPELKYRSLEHVGRSPQLAAMGLDNGSADRQPHSDAIGLARVKGLEEAIERRRVQPRARIPYCYQHAIRPIQLFFRLINRARLCHVGRI